MSATNAASQLVSSPAEPQVALFSAGDYSFVTDLSNIRMALYDARHHQAEDVSQYLRRYIDDIEKVHPSILHNRHRPTHFVVVAQTREEVEEALRQIHINAARAEHNRHMPVIILLYAADAMQLSESNLSDIKALYSLSGSSTSDDCHPFDVLAQALFAGRETVAQGEWISLDHGRLVSSSQSVSRLSYGLPESVGMDSKALDKIDDVAHQMIRDQASPGCYVLIARRGRVVFSRGYGHTLYNDGLTIDGDKLYDIASVSKAFGTLPVVMHAFDEKKIDAETTLGSILHEVDSAKASISMSQLLLHQSGLSAGVAHYLLCVDSTSFASSLYSNRLKPGYRLQLESRLYLNDSASLKPGLFASERSDQYSVAVSTSCYTTDSMRMAVLDYIDKSRLLKKSYRYSDINFIYLQQVVERIYSKPLNLLWNQFVAKPLGIRRLTYRPLEHFTREEIVPTEDDKYFRNEQIWGTVHDQTAALLGGVSGNAGLFGTANEIAKIAQMYLQHGSYGGMQLISSSVVDAFTKRHSVTCRRGYGFDKPDIKGGGPVTDLASQSSYGHSGFSGTLVWVDPDKELIFIFLSNRICPKAYNNKLTTTNVRSNIHEIAYKAILDK